MSADKVEAAAAYAAHIIRENRERRIQVDADARTLAKVERAVAGIMAAIEDGLCQPVMKVRMAELEFGKAEITARLAEAPPTSPTCIPASPKSTSARLPGSLIRLDTPDTRLDASNDVRSLVGKIALHPGEKRGEVHATLHGPFIGILDLWTASRNPMAPEL